MNYRKIQKMASKKSKYKKITNQLKEILRAAYVQGELDPQGFRRVATIEELANDNQLSVNTLYKLAQRENLIALALILLKLYLLELAM